MAIRVWILKMKFNFPLMKMTVKSSRYPKLLGTNLFYYIKNVTA